MEKDLDKLSQLFSSSVSPDIHIHGFFFPVSMGKMDRNLNMLTLDIQNYFNILNSLSSIFFSAKIIYEICPELASSISVPGP